MHAGLKKTLGGLAVLAWPLAIYLLHDSVGNWPLLIVGALLLVWRVPQARYLALIAAAALIALGLLSRAEFGMRAYPVAISTLMFCLFFASLLKGQPMIEQLARLREPDLSAKGVRYTRKVTWAWCGFFVVNGAIASWTVLYADLATWALYNGVISYVLMGLMFAGEWLIRRRVRGVAV